MSIFAAQLGTMRQIRFIADLNVLDEIRQKYLSTPDIYEFAQKTSYIHYA